MSGASPFTNEAESDGHSANTTGKSEPLISMEPAFFPEDGRFRLRREPLV